MLSPVLKVSVSLFGLVSSGFLNQAAIAQGIILDLPSTVQISPITSQEIVGSQRVFTVPGTTRVLNFDPRFGFNPPPVNVGTSSGLGGVNSVLLREFPNLWQATIPADASLNDIQVTYEFFGTNCTNCLTNVVSPSSQILIQNIQPQPVTLIGPTENGKIIQGGVNLNLNLNNITFSGTYQTTLRVTVFYQQ